MGRAVNPMMRRIQEAVEDFRQAEDRDALWGRLHHHLSGLGITGVLYGVDGAKAVGEPYDLLLNSLDPDWLREKFDRGLFHCDAFVELSRNQPAPVLWGNTSVIPLEELSREALDSLALDHDYRVLTGVTFPIHRYGGVGRSAFGCQAADLSWPEFEALWAEAEVGISGILQAFDSAMHRDHLTSLFALTAEERECLLWMASGMLHKNIADRMTLSERQVGVRVERACAKLKARTATQAVTRAILFGLITP